MDAELIKDFLEFKQQIEEGIHIINGDNKEIYNKDKKNIIFLPRESINQEYENYIDNFNQQIYPLFRYAIKKPAILDESVQLGHEDINARVLLKNIIKVNNFNFNIKVLDELYYSEKFPKKIYKKLN